MPNCPECTSREKKKIQSKYEADTPEEDRGRDDLYKLFDEIEIPMKMDEKPQSISFVKDVDYTQQENKYQISDTNLIKKREHVKTNMMTILIGGQKVKKKKQEN